LNWINALLLGLKILVIFSFYRGYGNGSVNNLIESGLTYLETEHILWFSR